MRTAVTAGAAISSRAAQSERPSACNPARHARADTAWRRHTASGPSAKYSSSAASSPLISAVEGVNGKGWSRRQASFQSVRLRIDALGAFGLAAI